MDFLATMPLLNLIILLVFLVIVIILLINFFKDKKLKLGNAEITSEKERVVTSTRISEREIIKKQMHIARAVCSNFQCKVPHRKEYDELTIENICYKVSDEVEDLILFNHLSTDDDYINSRFQLIWSVIEKNLNDNFTDEDKRSLERIVKENFKKLISILLNVREEETEKTSEEVIK